jgi:hypothetical protein
MGCALSVVVVAQAAGQPGLYGVRSNGDVVRIDPAGPAVLMGSSGVACNAATGYGIEDRFSHADLILVAGLGDQVFALRPDGSVVWTLNTTGRPPGYAITAMARKSFFNLYVILSAEAPSAIDLLATIDIGTSPAAYQVIGPTGRAGLTALAISPAGTLYAIDTEGGGTLYTLNPSTGAATLVGGGPFGTDGRALESIRDGSLRACGANLVSVNGATGAATPIGPTGFNDIRGLALLPTCYGNCDSGGPPPLLNVNDFACFLNRFAFGDSYANCDFSSTPPVLNVNDFICFLNTWVSAAGCN